MKSIVNRFWHLLGLATVADINKTKEQIMKTQAELTADLEAILAQNQKTATEIAGIQTESTALQARVTELEAVIAAGGNVSPELEAAVAAVKAQAQVLDDQIPDVVVLPVV